MTDEDIEKLRNLLLATFGCETVSAATGSIASIGRGYAEEQLDLLGRGAQAGFRGDERIAAAVRDAQMHGPTPKEAGVTLQMCQRQLREVIQARYD